MVKDMKVAMMVAVGKALDYKKKKPNVDIEEIAKYLMKLIKSQGKMKIASIAAASRAIKYKEQNPRELDKKIMQRVMNDIDEILKTTEEE